MYLEHVPARKSAKWVAPSAEEMARLRREAGTDETAMANADEEQRGALSGETERGAEGAGSKPAERNGSTAHAEDAVVR